MVSNEQKGTRKDQSWAKLCFWLSLANIIPLLGIITGAISTIFGIIAVVNIHKRPKEFGGMKWAVAGLIIDAVFIAAWVYAALLIPEQLLGLQ